jgi:hypothetical protein
MLTRAEAQSVVEASLRAREPTEPMTPKQMLRFCQSMHAVLPFESKGDPMSDIRKWAERWESMWFR